MSKGLISKIIVLSYCPLLAPSFLLPAWDSSTSNWFGLKPYRVIFPKPKNTTRKINMLAQRILYLHSILVISKLRSSKEKEMNS
jgi:hypothetical protein